MNKSSHRRVVRRAGACFGNLGHALETLSIHALSILEVLTASKCISPYLKSNQHIYIYS